MKKILYKASLPLLFILLFALSVSGQPWTAYNFDQWRVQQCGLAWGDVNKDGWMDLVIAGQDNDTVAQRTRILINSRDGANFDASPQELDGFYGGSVSLVDYDNDGDLDLSINGSVPGAGFIDLCRFRIYPNLGNGTFSPAYIEPVPNWGTWYGNVEWGDYDNDGLMDFAITGDANGPGIGSGCALRIYQNRGNGNFMMQLNADANGYLEYSSVCWGDFDNDGDLDLVFSGINGTAGGPSENTFKLHWYRNDAGTFTGPFDIDTAAFSPPLGYKRVSFASGDFDNDGILEFVAAGHSSRDVILKFRIYKYIGGGNWSASDIVGATFGVVGGSVAAGDIDNNGVLDLVITGYNGSVKIMHVYTGNGNLTFGGPSQPELNWGVGDDNFTPPVEYGYTGASLALADFDNDGDLDIAVAGRDTSALPRFRIYKNNLGANTPPGTPPGLQALNNGGYWRLRWSAASDTQTTDPDLMRYHVAIGTNVSGTYNCASSNLYYPRGQARVGNARSGSVFYDSRIPWANFKQVYWKVLAVDTSFKTSPYSRENTVLPEWVSSISMETNRIDLVWRRLNINNATGYTLFRNTSGNPAGAVRFYVGGGGVTNYSDTTLLKGTRYFYWLKANTTWAVTTPYSVCLSNRTVSIGPPQWISAVDVSDFQVDLLWRDLNNETSYTLFRNTADDPLTAVKIAGRGANVTNYSDTTCAPSTLYYYWLKAYNALDSSVFSVSISTRTRLPRPQWIYAHAISTNQVDLLWHDLVNETSYTLFRNTVNNTSTFVRVSGFAPGQTNYIDGNLPGEVTYYYWLRGYDAEGPSLFSDPVAVLVGHNIFSKILFPLNNAFVEKVSFFKGTVSAIAPIQEEQVLLQRMSDTLYYNGTNWQSGEAWLTCNGTSDWLYNVITDRIFTYGVQYTLKARGRDIYGLWESEYPSVLFTYLYSEDFKQSVAGYPNPFYPDSSDSSKNTITLEYFLSVERNVNLYIYAVNGELVKKWSGAEYNRPGLHRVKWDGRNQNGSVVGSGVYILIITADNEKQIDKISVVR